MIEFGMDPQSALDALRVCIGPTKGISHETDEVYLEDGMSASTVAGLTDKGHNVIVLKGHARAQFGRGQIIAQVMRRAPHGEERRVYVAGSDLRADGCAFGY